MATVSAISSIPSPSILSPLKLTPTQEHYLLRLGVFAAKAANNDSETIRMEWLRLPSIADKLQIPQFDLERSFLDALTLVHIFVGVPKSIEALNTIHQTRRHDFTKAVVKPAASYLWPETRDSNWAHPNLSQLPTARCSNCADPNSSAIRRARATATLDAIYTTARPGLEAALNKLHPIFYGHIISHGYGQAMCTDRLTLFEIETVAVAILSGLHTPRQLLSHLRGAVMVGLPQPFLTQLMDDVFEEVWQDDGIYGESKEIWRMLQRDLRAKAAKQSGKMISSEEEDRIKQELEFQDQVQRSKRMAQQGQQHPLFTSGQHIGHGDPDEEEEDMKPPQRAGEKNPSNVSNGASTSPPLSDEEIESTMKKMFRQRQDRLTAEAATRPPGAPISTEDRWLVPPHVLDPTGGMGGAGMSAPGMSMGMGMGMPMGGMGMGMGGGPGMMSMTMAPTVMRSRL